MLTRDALRTALYAVPLGVLALQAVDVPAMFRTLQRGVQPAPSIVYGLGARSCRVWIEESKSGETPQTVAMMEWVRGYLTASGILLAATNQSTGLEKTESDPYGAYRVVRFIDVYCQNDPSNTIFDAAQALVDARIVQKP